jgi:Protein of unknown function (DUF3024)
VAEHGLPELDVARVRRWCDQRVPRHIRDKLRIECEPGPRYLTIVERTPLWRSDIDREWTRSPVARLRYTKTTRTWTLYWRDSHSRFHRYDGIEPAAHVDALLQEIEHDPTAIFWG